MMFILRSVGYFIGSILVICVLSSSFGLDPDRLWSLMWDGIFIVVIGRVLVFLWRHNFPAPVAPDRPLRPTIGQQIPNAEVIRLIRKQKKRD